MKTRSVTLRKKKIQLKPIGIIHSPFKKIVGIPIQTVFSDKGNGTVELLPEYKEGLKDLEGFSHIILIYYFHRSKGYRLICRPFLDRVERGVFATRAPARPNPIGLSIVRVKKIRGNMIKVASLDILDGTPLIDIKPYIPQFDAPRVLKGGWLEKAYKNKEGMTKSDGRFTL